MKRTRIKICGFTRTQDLEQAVSLGVDAVGLVFVKKSPRHLSPTQAHEISANLPAFVSKVGLFMDHTKAQIEAVLEKVSLDMLQFHGDESPEFCQQWHLPYIKAIPMAQPLDPRQYAAKFANCRGFLLDSHASGQLGGSGETFDWGIIPSNWQHPLILAGGLTIENVADAIRQVRPFAVDVSSGVESAKGIKDGELMRKFIEQVNLGDRNYAEHG